ncbi:transposase is4 [Holotrichia oblita]|uniref:Transposase is4 n=1 Tax=Holotrichia oblita TaxID=644536 RepID=A0ACB9SLJ4_HOLOL|nr:transposase is4 [Holotrichia oblita]
MVVRGKEDDHGRNGFNWREIASDRRRIGNEKLHYKNESLQKCYMRAKRAQTTSNSNMDENIQANEPYAAQILLENGAGTGGDSDAEDQPIHNKCATVCLTRSSAGLSSTSRIPFEDNDDEGNDLEKDLHYNVNEETVSPSREIHCNLDNNNSSDSSEDSDVDNNSTALTTWKWGDSDFAMAKDSDISVSKWRDRGKKTVVAVSSFHDPSTSKQVLRTNKTGIRKPVQCPNSIADYDSFSGGKEGGGGVDLFDQLLSSYFISWKSGRWWVKIPYFLVI